MSESVVQLRGRELSSSSSYFLPFISYLLEHVPVGMTMRPSRGGMGRRRRRCGVMVGGIGYPLETLGCVIQ